MKTGSNFRLHHSFMPCIVHPCEVAVKSSQARLSPAIIPRYPVTDMPTQVEQALYDLASPTKENPPDHPSTGGLNA
eukprot:1159514-Pelagomonas_calceolata.AAC.5